MIAGDYVADNGVVHVLDSVLAPQGLLTQHVMGGLKRARSTHSVAGHQQLGPQGDLSFQVLIDNSYSEPDRDVARRIWPLKSRWKNKAGRWQTSWILRCCTNWSKTTSFNRPSHPAN